MLKKPFNKDEEEERLEQAEAYYEEEEDDHEIFNSMQRPQIWSGRQQTLRRHPTSMNSVSSWPAQASGAIRRRIWTTSEANAEAARRSQIQTHLSYPQQIPHINAHAASQSFPSSQDSSRYGAPEFYFSNQAVGLHSQEVQNQNPPMFHGHQPHETDYATSWYSQQPSTSQITINSERRTATQYPADCEFQVEVPPNASTQSQQSQFFESMLENGAHDSNHHWFPYHISQEPSSSQPQSGSPAMLQQPREANYTTSLQSQTATTHAGGRTDTQHLWFQVGSPSNEDIFNSQQSQFVEPKPEFGVVGANPQWLPSRTVHAASSGGVDSSFSLSLLAEGCYSQAQSEGSSPYPPQQTESRGISQQPKDPSNAGSAPMRRAKSRKKPKQYSQPFYCVLCESWGSMHSIKGHIKKYHDYGDEMECYEQTVFEDKAIYAPENAVENNELASCSNCHKVLFKHRAKFGNHDCAQHKFYRAIKYLSTIDEGQGDEYCLLCHLRCGNVNMHHKIAHNLNKVYKVGVIFGKTCLAPWHLNDKHREELNGHLALGGAFRFGYKCRARRSCDDIYN